MFERMDYIGHPKSNQRFMIKSVSVKSYNSLNRTKKHLSIWSEHNLRASFLNKLTS